MSETTRQERRDVITHGPGAVRELLLRALAAFDEQRFGDAFKEIGEAASLLTDEQHESVRDRLGRALAMGISRDFYDADSAVREALALLDNVNT